MNIVIMTQDDPFYVRLFFEEFFATYPAVREIKAVVVAPAMGKKSFKKLVLQMYQFYGPVDFVRVGIKYVLYKLASRAPGWLLAGRSFSIAQLCRRHDIPVLASRDLNAKPFLDELAAMAPELIVSVAAPQIFKEPLIRLPRRGCINIHNSKLPKYRGMMPNFWQMLHGEKSVGITVHRIDPVIDNGAILGQWEVPLEPGDTLDAVIRRTKTLGARLMIEVIQAIEAGTERAQPNPAELSSYYSFPTPADVREFRRRGHRLL